MTVENPLAYSYILQEDIYLLNADKDAFAQLPQLAPVVETQPLSFNYLGGRKKNFLILVHYPQLEFIEDKHLAALESTLGRLNYSLDDTAVVNLAHYPDAAYQDLHTYFSPQKLLIMGVNALPAAAPALQQNQVTGLNSCNTLYSFSFDEMMESNDNKKAFWEQMKQL